MLIFCENNKGFLFYLFIMKSFSFYGVGRVAGAPRGLQNRLRDA